MSEEHEFEELASVATVAKKVGISTESLRRYSSMVEKVTGNDHYFERTKQKSRLYRKQDIKDLEAMRRLTKEQGLTIEKAARQIFEIHQPETDQQEVLDPAKMQQLLGALQQTIAAQNKVISQLESKLDTIAAQNKEILAAQKQADKAPKLGRHSAGIDPEIEALPDISGIVRDSGSKEEQAPKTPAEKRNQVEADKQKSAAEVHRDILAKAQENSQRRSQASRTLADMQLPKKQHWWQRFLNV